MTVHCPHCATGYLLPDHLLGPRGARVRCPTCHRPFVVLREDAPASAAPASGASPAVVVEAAQAEEPKVQAAVDATPGTAVPAEAPAGEKRAEPAAGPEALATEILEALAVRLGHRLTEARGRGRVLAELGPELMKAYDDYRARAGAEASRESFGAVLRQRWGVDLFGGR